MADPVLKFPPEQKGNPASPESRPKLAAEPRHFPVVLGKSFLAPRVRHRREQGDQRDRAREQYPLPHPVLDQLEIVLERGAEQRLSGQEHHHHLR